MTRRLVAGALALAAIAFPERLVRSQPPAWTVVPTGVTARLRGISAVSPRVVWASGTGGTVIHTEDGGKTWIPSTIPDAAGLDFRDIDAVDARTAFVLSIGDGDASRIYRTNDAGRTWTLQFRNDNPRAFFDAMAFRDARTGVAMSDAVDGKLIVIRTSDGGAHWTPIAGGLPPAIEGEGAFAASGTVVAVAGDRIWLATSKSRVIRTADNGRTWTAATTPLPTGPSAGIFSIGFSDPAHGIVVGGDYKTPDAAVDNAAITADGGATWTLVKGLGGFRSAVGFVRAMPDAREVVVAVGPNGSDYSTDGGRSWNPLGGPGFHTLSIARGTRVVWAAGENGTVARVGF